ncbi:hypothetical protein FQN50_004807 [Emmonsiellopsis sp. PD_5]|nr:hypothetical protein FQN50_004807 [Emmonsiellopsis sp. PD_5]
MPSESSIQQSLLDTINRSFYQQVPDDATEKPQTASASHPPQTSAGPGLTSDTAYNPPHARIQMTAIQGDNNNNDPTYPINHQQHHHHHHYEPPARPASGLVFILRWICTILTVASTILFGVWAPLSYAATNRASKDNELAQRELFDSIESASAVAESALSVASAQLYVAGAQATAIGNLQGQLGAMGQIALLQYCGLQVDVAVATLCSAFADSVEFTSLIAQIATPPPTITAPPTTSLPTTKPGSGGGSISPPATELGLSIASILGIVFGGTAGVGIIMGYIVWRHQKGRLVATHRQF